MMPENPQDSLLGKIAAYTEILSKDPRSTIFVSLGEAYRKMGLLEEAYSVSTKGLEHLPDYAPGHVVLARVKCQQGDYTASEASFRKALELDPASLAALVGFSRLCLLQHEYSDAREILLRARSISPADPVINKLLLSLPEVPAEAPAPATPAKEQAPKPESRQEPKSEPLESATLAELYLKQGMGDKALDIYRNLLGRDPDNLQLRRRIRDLELRLSGQDVPSEEVHGAVGEKVPASASVRLTPDADKTASQDVLADAPVLDRLNRLLLSIQKRRGDV